MKKELMLPVGDVNFGLSLFKKQVPGRPVLFFLGSAPSKYSKVPFCGMTGRKLAEMAGVDPGNFPHVFQTWNIVRQWQGKNGKGDRFQPTRDDVALAYKQIDCSIQLGVTHVIVVGQAGAKAMGVGYKPILQWFPKLVAGRQSQWMVIPHPSGVNRFYNDPSNKRRVVRALRKIVNQSLGR